MNKKTYFLKSIRDNAHYAREWVLRCFSVVIDDPQEKPWALRHTDQAVEVYVPEGDGGRWEVLEDVEPYETPFVYHESAGPLKAGDLINLKKDIGPQDYGNILINARVLSYAVGDRIEYMEGEISPAQIERVFVKRMKDNPQPGEPEDESALYVKHWLRIGKAVGDLDGFELFVPSITEHALQPYPGLEDDRAKLLAEAKDLFDPVEQAKIQNELVSKYKTYLKGDPSEGFAIKGKTINTALKQMFLIHGPEAGFSEGSRAVLVPNSLDEGINVDYFPEMMNSLRAGAFYRGAMTALAGTDVDLIARIFQDVKIVDGFCGTTEPVGNFSIDERFLTRWIQVGKERVQLTPENIGRYKQTKQYLFDPLTCKAGGPGQNDVCEVCIGGALAAYKTSLGMTASGKQSTLMSTMMASAHAKELVTVPLKDDYLE